jgi:hypothetical protein
MAFSCPFGILIHQIAFLAALELPILGVSSAYDLFQNYFQ